MSDWYRVESSPREEVACTCAQCTWWGIVSDDPEPVEIGQNWSGPAGKEAAEDICELMNMAFQRGVESVPGAKRVADLEKIVGNLCPHSVGTCVMDCKCLRRTSSSSASGDNQEGDTK